MINTRQPESKEIKPIAPTQYSEEELMSFLYSSKMRFKEVKNFFMKLNQPLSKTILCCELAQGFNFFAASACVDAELFQKIVQLTPAEVLDELLTQQFIMGFNILHLLASFQIKHPECLIALYEKAGQDALDIAFETLNQENISALQTIFILQKPEAILATINKTSQMVLERSILATHAFNFMHEIMLKCTDEVVIALLNKISPSAYNEIAFTLFEGKYPLHLAIQANRSETVLNALISPLAKELFEELIFLQDEEKLIPIAYGCGMVGKTLFTDLNESENKSAIHFLNLIPSEKLPELANQLSATPHPKDKELNLLETAAFYNPLFFNLLIKKLRKLEGDAAVIDRIANNHRLLKRLNIENARPLLAMDTDFELKIPDIERGNAKTKFGQWTFRNQYGKKIDENWRTAGKENQSELNLLMNVYRYLDQYSFPSEIALLTLQYLADEDYMIVRIRNELDKPLKKPFLSTAYHEFNQCLMNSTGIPGKEKPELLVMEYLAPHPNVAKAIFHEIKEEKKKKDAELKSKKNTSGFAFFSNLFSSKSSKPSIKADQATNVEFKRAGR